VSGSRTQTLTRYYPTPPPPPLVTDATVSQQITVHTNRVFHGNPATDFHTVETDAGPNQTIVTTSDVYIVFPPSGEGQILNIGFHSTDSNGVVLDVQNLSGNGIVGEVPLPDSGGWSNNAAQIISEIDPDGTQTNVTFNPNGTYNLTINDLAGTTTASDAADGSGSANVPSTSFWPPTFAGTGTNVNVSAPSGGNITFTLSPVGPAPTPTPIVVQFPPWYPTPVTLASDQTTIEGGTSLPGGCTALAPDGIQLHEVKSSLDPVFGTLENETIDTWVSASLGPVCQQTSDTQSVYYDFTGQSNPIPLGFLTQQTQTSELLGLATPPHENALERVSGKAGAGRLPLGVEQALASVRAQRRQILTRIRLLRALEGRKQWSFIR
jgi:hypothetical protein